MKLNKTFLIISLLTLGACASVPPKAEIKLVPVPKYEAVLPNDSLFTCPHIQLKDIPNPKTATDKQTSQLIVKLYQNNISCQYSLDAVHNFLLDAKKKIDQENNNNLKTKQ